MIELKVGYVFKQNSCNISIVLSNCTLKHYPQHMIRNYLIDLVQKSGYMGCYNDKAGGLESYRKLSLNQRALRGAVEADWLKTYMTVDYCLNFCRRKGDNSQLVRQEY